MFHPWNTAGLFSKRVFFSYCWGVTAPALSAGQASLSSSPFVAFWKHNYPPPPRATLLWGISVDKGTFLWQCQYFRFPAFLRPWYLTHSRPWCLAEAVFVELIGLLLSMHAFLINAQASLQEENPAYWQELQLFSFFVAVLCDSVCTTKVPQGSV